VERKWWTLIAVSVAIFMLLLDITVVNVALPDIQRSLHSSFSDLQWVVNAYALTLAAFLLTSGSVADLIGRKRVFIAGLFVFTTASAVCGLSSTPLMLNLARAVQGTGGAMMFATALALIAEAFHGKERGTAFGVFGAVTGAAVAVGPVLGGIITSGIGWKWVFFVNIPIGVAAVFISFTKVQDSRDPNATGVDWLGLVTFSGSLFLLVYALVQGNAKGWGSTEIVAFLSAAVLLMVAFVVVEHIQSRPMLDLSLFRYPRFVGVQMLPIATCYCYVVLLVILPLRFIGIEGRSPVDAGILLIALSAPMLVVPLIAAMLTRWFSAGALSGFGLLIASAGLLMLGRVDPSHSGGAAVLPMLIIGIGSGLPWGLMDGLSVSVVPKERAGMATGIFSTTRVAGEGIALASVTAIMAALLKASLTPMLRVARSEVAQRLASGDLTAAADSLPALSRHTLVTSYALAFQHLSYVLIAITLASAVAAFALLRHTEANG
jgi:EmrB/QacA subfamily drug resistance transporter